MQVNKLNFTSEELGVLSNSDFFVVKHQATQKISLILSHLLQELENSENIQSFPLQGLNEKRGKIFRGENYRLLPYVVLDYPRQFGKESVFAFRSMFWWGNGFSFTLHIQGEALIMFNDRLHSNLYQLTGKGFYVCINTTPWEYHYGTDNYIPLEEYIAKSQKYKARSNDFFKLSRRLTLQQYSLVPEFGKETWELLKKILE